MADADEKKNMSSNAKTAVGIIVISIIGLWVLLGLAAFIVSLVCFGYGGDNTDKFLGLFIAILFGPFYWFYYGFNKSYCTKTS